MQIKDIDICETMCVLKFDTHADGNIDNKQWLTTRNL